MTIPALECLKKYEPLLQPGLGHGPCIEEIERSGTREEMDELAAEVPAPIKSRYRVLVQRIADFDPGVIDAAHAADEIAREFRELADHDAWPIED